MVRHGIAPYLECSSRGEKRLSAFYAVVNGKSIETQYQAAKVFSDGSTNLHWRAAKGRQAINAAYCADLYSKLWDQYIAEHPELAKLIVAASGISDLFGQRGHCCQATELWRIRSNLIRQMEIAK